MCYVLGMQATVGDGLQAVAQLAQGSSANSAAGTQHAAELMSHASGPTQSPVSYDSSHSQHLDLLVVDAGSGDASLPMSCPPAPFLESAFLGDAKQALKPGGMLAVNCVSRAAEPYRAAVKALQVGAQPILSLCTNLCPVLSLFTNLCPVLE